MEHSAGLLCIRPDFLSDFYSPQSFEANLKTALFFFLSFFLSQRRFVKIKYFEFFYSLKGFLDSFARLCKVWCGFAWFCMVLHCFAWFLVVLHGFAWFWRVLEGFG